MWSRIQKLILGSLLLLSWMLPAQAQDTLTQAEVYKLLNQVLVLIRNKNPRPAKKADILVPLDALQTKAKSGAELLFNEGSLARVGSNAIFRFKPGMRRFQLPGGGLRAETIFELRNGIALILNPPGSTGTTVETPQSRIEFIAAAPPQVPPTAPNILSPSVTSSAVAISHDGAKNITQIFNLTNLPIKVSNLDGTQVQFLKAGQTVSVQNGVIGPVQTFNLERFYKTSQLAAGLGPGQEAIVAQESPKVQAILNAVRKETLAGLQSQKLWIEGLCTLNSRGGASTLATNCITTNDDPIRRWEENREVVTPTRTPGTPPVPPSDTPPTQPPTSVSQSDTPSIQPPTSVPQSDTPRPEPPPQ